MKRKILTLTFLSAIMAVQGTVTAKGVPEGGVNYPQAQMPAQPFTSGAVDRGLRSFSLDGETSESQESRDCMSGIAKRLGAKGQLLVGYNSYNYRGVPIGMHKLNTAGEFDYLYTSGYSRDGYRMKGAWMRNGKMCSIYSLDSNAILDYVYTESDPMTGEVSLEKHISLKAPDTGFDNFLPYYISCAYDPTDDTLWGYTNSEHGDGYSFFTAPAGDMQNTTAVVAKEKWERVCASICYNTKEKALYGVNRENNLVRIERDGSETLVMELGVRTEYATTALFYDEGDDCYYWYANLLDANSGLYCIDPKGNSLTLIVDYSGRLAFPFLTVVSADEDRAPISKPILDKFDFGKAQHEGSISIFMPQSYYSGESLSGSMTWHAYVDDNEYSSGTAEAGEKVVIPFAGLTDGFHTFAFDVDQNGTKSSRAAKSYFIGYDTPPMVENVKLTQTTVSWDPVLRGVKGGYLDQANLIYNVYINGEKVGEVKNATSYEWPSDSELPFAGYVATVTVDNHGYISEMSEESDILRFGKEWTLPFEVAPTSVEALAFTPFDLNEDENTWGYVRVQDKYDTFMEPLNFYGSDDWIFSPPIKIEDVNPFYEFAFDVANLKPYYKGLDIQVYLCNAMDPEGVVETLYDAAPAADKMWHPVSKLFNITTPGTYYIAMHVGRKDSSQGYGIYVRDLSVKNTGITAPLPSTVTGLKAWGGEKGALTADVELVIPEKYLNGQDIPDDVEIKVELTVQNEVELPGKVEVVGKKGEKKTAVLTTAQGINEIIAVPSIDGLNGQSTSVRVYCGYDVPGPVSNITAKTSEDNLSLHLTWGPPTELGARGYYCDPTKVEYVIMRSTSEGWQEHDRVAGDVFEYTFTVDGGNGLKSEWLGIVAANVAGQDNEYAWMSDMLGTPYTLPAVEDFYGGNLRYSPIRMVRTNDPDRVTDWSFVNPQSYVGASSHSVVLLGSTLQAPAGSMLMLPKFSTEGLKDAGMTIEVWNGANMAKMAVYGDIYGYDEPVKLSDIPAGTGWYKHSFRFPEAFQNQKWISLYISADYNAEKKIAMVAGYEVSDGHGLDSVESIQAGETGIYGGDFIEVRGHAGETVRVFSAEGSLVKEISDVQAEISISVAPGIYVVVTDTATAKVITH